MGYINDHHDDEMYEDYLNRMSRKRVDKNKQPKKRRRKSSDEKQKNRNF